MRFNFIVLRWILTSVLIFFSSFVLLADLKEIEVHVLPESVVYNANYQLGDIAELDGFDIDLIQQIAKLEIGKSPLPGRSIILSKSLIRSKLRNNFKNINFKIDLPRKAMISLASIKVSKNQIASIIRSEIKRKYQDFDDIKIMIKTQLKDLYLPKGVTFYTMAPLRKYQKIGGNSTWKINFVVNQKVARQILVMVKIDVTDEVIVAKDQIRKGSFIKQSDLIKVRKNISKKRWDNKKSASFGVGQIARRDISQNEEVKQYLVEKPKIVSRGDRIQLTYKSKSVTFTNVVVAMRSGSKGDMIPVKTVKNKKTIYAVVVDAKHVEVTL